MLDYKVDLQRRRIYKVRMSIKNMRKEKLNSKNIIEKIEEKKDKIKEKGVKKIGVFGSFAKDEQKWGSDIDILVEFDKNTFDNYFGLWCLLEKLFRKKIDLVIEKSLRPELNYVKKEVKYARL